MNFLEFTIGLLCVTVTFSTPLDTPECSKGPIYAHSTDCGKYLTCSHGVVTEMQCPSGLLFDNKAHICNHAHDVVCKKPEEEKPNEPEEVDDVPDIKHCLSHRGQFPHPKNCKKYYDCWDETVLIRTCPDGLLFDAKKVHCAHPDTAQCFVTDVKPNEPKEPEQVDEIPDHKNCLSHRGQFPHPKNCKKYYDCWDETVLIRTCPDGLLFDAKKVHCALPDTAQCFVIEIRKEEENKEKEGKEILDKRFCLSSRGQFPHPTDCRKYYNCWDENIVISECPVGTVFEPVKHYCVASESTSCQVKRINYKVANSRQNLALFLSLQRTVQDLADYDDDKYIKGVRITGYKCPMARGQFAHEKACRMFYNCWDEVVLLQKCPQGLLFDPVVRICDSPDRVNCQGKFLPGTDEDKTTPKVKCNIEEGLMAKEGDCRRFYICHNGLGSEFICPSNLHFDVDAKACGYPEDVRCTGSKKDETPNKEVTDLLVKPTEKTNQSKVGRKCEGRADGIYETTECGSFIKCVAGRTYPYKCPANLSYDARTKRCDYTENVPKCI